jgi:O-antigen/teichoic acid export membrane protein
MDRKQNLILFKNAVANLIRGSATALVAIIMPIFLTRLMSPVRFGAWSLVLQLSACVGYLDFGLQTAIGRFFAHASETGDNEQRDGINSTAMAALATAGATGVAGSIALAFWLPRIFHQIPQSLSGDARWALGLVGGSLAVGLPFGLFNGIFVGLQRYEVPAAVIAISRLLTAALLILIVRRGGSLLQMAEAMVAINLATYGMQYLLYRRMVPGVRISSRLVSMLAGRQLYGYCISLTIWSFSMLLVNGLDVSMVAYFDFKKLAFYSVAATLTIFLAGVQNALFAVLIPSTAILQARGDAVQLGRVMITATRYGSIILLFLGLPLIFAAKIILSIWVGAVYAEQAVRLLQVLAVANIIRLSAVPYVMTLLGTGQQRFVTVTPMIEGVCNLLTSMIVGYFLGAIGVAIGTLVGAVVGVASNFVYNMHRSVGIKFAISDYVRDGLLRPLVCALPVAVLALAFRVAGLADRRTLYAGTASALAGTVVLIWRWGLLGSEREKLQSLCLASQA